MGQRWLAAVMVVAAAAAGMAGAQESSTPAASPATPAASPAATAAAPVSSGVAMVTFTFDRPGLAVPRYRMVVREDGTGRFDGEELAGAAAGTAASGTATTPVAQDLTLTPATTAKIFKLARAQKEFRVTCASKAKNIADTGAKTLSYEGPDGKGSCAYNYSENKDVVALTELFLAIGQTLEEGRRLEFKRRYDHLGLDAELDALMQANDSGRAVELGTIAPLLRQLAGDTDSMERVRLRAAKLLDRASAGK